MEGISTHPAFAEKRVCYAAVIGGASLAAGGAWSALFLSHMICCLLKTLHSTLRSETLIQNHSHELNYLRLLFDVIHITHQILNAFLGGRWQDLATTHPYI